MKTSTERIQLRVEENAEEDTTKEEEEEEVNFDDI